MSYNSDLGTLYRCRHLSLHLFLSLHFILSNSFKPFMLYGTFKSFRFYIFLQIKSSHHGFSDNCYISYIQAVCQYRSSKATMLKVPTIFFLLSSMLNLSIPAEDCCQKRTVSDVASELNGVYHFKRHGGEVYDVKCLDGCVYTK